MASNTQEVYGKRPKYEENPNFTENVIKAMGPKTHPRMREVMTSLIRHVHEVARETNLTTEEWMAGVELLNEAGRMSTASRNEGSFMWAVIGLESLCDEITFAQLASTTGHPTDLDPAGALGSASPTLSAILGPFYRANAPILPRDASIVQPNSLPTNLPADHTYLHGHIYSSANGKPIENAEIDIWHTAPNGLYEQQDPNQPDMNLRGRFYTDENGEFGLYCLRPTCYPIPDDGPAGRLLYMLDKHPFRPAHIHCIVSAPGFQPLVTQIFDRRDKYIDNDTAFAVKSSLVVDFVPREGDPKAQFELEYNFTLAPAVEKKSSSENS